MRIPNSINFSKQLVRWRLWLSEVSLDFVHGTGIKHQAAEALLWLNRTDRDKCSLENDLPLWVTDDVGGPPISIYTIAHDEDHLREVPNTNASNDKIHYNPQFHIKIIRAQQQDTSRCATATQVWLHNSELIVNEGSLLVRETHIDGAIQIMLPPSLHQHVLIMSRYSAIEEYSGQRRMYRTLKWTLYWLHTNRCCLLCRTKLLKLRPK